MNTPDLPKLPSSEWARLLGIRIVDPDGWDRKNFEASWSEPITVDEFRSRALRSTHDMRRSTEVFGR